MKKFTTILLMLLIMTMGAWATVTQPTLTTDPSNPTYYVIKSYRTDKFANFVDASTQLTQVSALSVNTLWYFMANGDGVSMVPVADPSVKLATTSSATADGAIWYLKENPYNAGYFCVSLSSNLSSNCWDDQGGIGYWQPSSSDFEGTSWTIMEATVTKADVDGGNIDYTFLTQKVNAIDRLAGFSSLSGYQTNLSAVKNATNATALGTALQAFETSISLLCGSNKYLIAGESAGSFNASPAPYENAIQLISAGDGSFYLQGYLSQKYMGAVAGSAAISTTTNPEVSFVIQSYNGNTVVRQSTGTNTGYQYIHNGGSGCVGWVANAGNSQYTMEEVTLPAAMVNVKYHLLFGGNDIKQETVEHGVGDAPAAPASFAYAFTTYTYDVPEITATTTDVYATPTFNMPFTVSTDYSSATWYYVNGHAYYNGTYFISTNGDAIDFNNNGLSRTDAYKWAFIGNPIDGIKIINKASGGSKYINATTPATMGTTEKAWTLKQQTNTTYYSGEKGFGFYDDDLKYVNCRTGDHNLQYWTSFDTGSTFWVEDVDAVTSDKNLLATTIAAAKALVDGAGNPGYITALAAATLSDAITDAQGVYNNPSGDYGSAYYSLAAAIATATDPSNINYTPRTNVYYTLVNTRGAMVYDPSHSSQTDQTNGSAEYLWFYDTDANHNTALTPSDVDDQDNNNLWGFIEQDGKYYIYNVGKQQFATVGTGGYGATWIFSDTPAYITLDDGIADEIVAPLVRVRATIATTNQSYTMSISTGYVGPIITYDAANDGGVPILFTPSSKPVDATITEIMTAKVEDVTPYRNALKDLIDACALIPIGTGANHYATNATYTDALDAANTAYNNASATKNELQTANVNLENAIAGLTLNLPAAGFYRIKGNTSGKYLAAGLASNNKFNMSDATDATTIFYFDGTKLTNYGSGMSNGMTSSSWDWVLGANASEVVFQDGLTNGGYGIKSATCNFYDNGDGQVNSADRGNNVTISATTNARYTSWYLDAVTDLPITLNNVTPDNTGTQYIATLCLPVNVTITGTNAYVVKVNTAGDEATATGVTGVIKAGTPLVLDGDAASATATITTDDASDVECDLVGTYEAKNVDGLTDYFLSRYQSHTGWTAAFLHWQGTALKGFRAYLPASKVSSSAKGLTIVFGDETNSISNIELNDTNNEIYNLQGQKVNRAQRGVYIVNGRKVVIK